MSKNTSPLRYPGGKTRACKILDIIIQDHFKTASFDTIVSPFFGGGSFEFYIEHKLRYNIIANDKFTPLYNFWQSCKSNKNELCSELYKLLDTVDKEKFLKMRKDITTTIDPLQQSILYFAINRCSFSGSTLSGGFSLESSKKRFTKSSIERIQALDLSMFEIKNIDFKEFIEEEYKEKRLLFLDPPYYLENKSKLYGNNGDMHEHFDHSELYNCIKNKKNWLMTYNNCDYIKDLYKNFKIIETSWTYGMNSSKKSSEIVIIG